MGHGNKCLDLIMSFSIQLNKAFENDLQYHYSKHSVDEQCCVKYSSIQINVRRHDSVFSFCRFTSVKKSAPVFVLNLVTRFNICWVNTKALTVLSLEFCFSFD